MDTLGQSAQQIWTMLGVWLDGLLALVPRGVTVAVVLLIGLLVAFAARALFRWGTDRIGLAALAERAGVARVLYGMGIKRGLADVAGVLAFWVVILGTLHTAAGLAGLPGLSELFGAVVAYVPRLLTSVGILVAGILGADLLSRLLERVLSQRNDIDSPRLVGRVAYWVVIVLSIVVAVEQLGLELDLVNALIQIVAASVGLALALAFGVGARSIFGNVVARFYATRLFRVGDRVVFAELDGTIIAFSPTSVFLQCGRDEAVVPCHRFMNEAVVIHRIQSPADPPPPERPDESPISQQV